MYVEPSGSTAVFVWGRTVTLSLSQIASAESSTARRHTFRPTTPTPYSASEGAAFPGPEIPSTAATQPYQSGEPMVHVG